MWLVTNDCCGMVCAFFTYLIVAFVYWGFIRIGIWEGIMTGDIRVLFHYIIFQYNCIMIFWSHWKCMTTEPGILPKQEFIQFRKLPVHLQDVIQKIGIRMKALEKRIENDQKDKKEVVEVLDKHELRVLAAGAEDTSSSEEDEEDYDDQSPEAKQRRAERARRRNISSSMQRSVDRLLKNSVENGLHDKVIDSDGKIKFSRMQYDLDLYQSIVANIKGFDYKKCQENAKMIRTATPEERDQMTSKNKSSLIYKDDLSLRQIGHIESIFQRTCKKCDVLKVPMSHHCSTCKACIARMDHHCPWVNNCVGYWNQKFFLQFLVYVFLGSFHAFVLILMECYNCWGMNCAIFFGNSTMIIAGVSIFLALLFCIFVCVMFYDQIMCILENMSTIDKLQFKRQVARGERIKEEDLPEYKTSTERIKEVMTGRLNDDFDRWWLWPTDIVHELCIENEFF